jgi:alpha-glucuronidase
MDFQVREPISSIIGQLPNTNIMMEVQAAQEYTGQQIHLCNLVPQWQEILPSILNQMVQQKKDAQIMFVSFFIIMFVYAQICTPMTYIVPTGTGSTVARIVSGDLNDYKLSGMAAVGNIGNFANWTGHILAGANTYGFGRIAWEPTRSAESINQDWTKMAFGPDDKMVIDTVTSMLQRSWSVYELYDSPFGMGFVVEGGWGGGACRPGPVQAKPNNATNSSGLQDIAGKSHYWLDPKQDAGYSNASKDGVGCQRNSNNDGSTHYTAQYSAAAGAVYDSLETCPLELLLFFHNLPYNHSIVRGGQNTSLICAIYMNYEQGVTQLLGLHDDWLLLKGKIDEQRWEGVLARFLQSMADAAVWRAKMVGYFQGLSGIDPMSCSAPPSQLH